jgi:hypothetical protein
MVVPSPLFGDGGVPPLKMPDDGRWHTRHKGRGGDVVGHDCPCCDDGISSDGYSGQDGGRVPIHTFLSIVIGSTVM